jgi:hypothetical protein
MRGLLFSTNELKDAVFSLTLVNDCLAKVFQDHLYWKWVFIALHNSLQSFMVTALSPFTPDDVMKDARTAHSFCLTCRQEIYVSTKGQSPWDAWQAWSKDPSGPKPDSPRLFPFLDLYKRIKKPIYMERLVGARAFQPSGTQTQSVKRLNNEMRNDFTHFMPMTKLRPVEDFLLVVKDVTGIVSFLAFDSETIDWVNRNELRSKTKSLIAIISANISELEKVYAVRAKQEEPRDPELEVWAAALLKRCEEAAEE